MENKNELFRIKGVGLDTANLNYTPSLEPGDFGYIHIDLRSNNEEFISNFSKESNIFLTVDYLDNLSTSLNSFIAQNGLRSLQGLLINSKCDFDKFSDQLQELINLGIITESAVGISMPESVDRLKELDKIIKFKYISLNICPLSFNVEILNWAKENDKTIIGFNPFGGFLSYPNIISSFSIPYLLSFIATYADIVFLSSRDLIYSLSEKDYLESLIGSNSERLYLFTKSLNKLIQPIQKAIKNYLIVDESTAIELEDPVFGFDKNEIVISTVDTNVEEIPEPVLIQSIDGKVHYDALVNTAEEWINTHFKEDLENNKPEGISDESYLSLLKYRISELLTQYYNERYSDLYGVNEITINKFCKNAVLINTFVNYVEKTGLFTINKREESTTFLLYYKAGKFLFRKIQSKE